MRNRVLWTTLFLVGASTLTIRVLLDSRFGHGTLLYLIVPFGISIALSMFTSPIKQEGIGWGYINHLRLATIIFFATSAFLFEGFLCVLMFMPIYYVVVTIGYLFAWLLHHDRSENGTRLRAFTIPALMAALAIEGLMPQTTLPRDQSATYATVVPQDVTTLQRNMAAPIDFKGERPWFIRLFPLPDQIQAGSLREGDVHRLHFTYKKWFFANYQEGEMNVRIAEVSPRHIRTEVLGNTAYLSHYMEIYGTDVRFDPVSGGQTRVTLTIRYRRLLDPAWYFGPLQRLAAEQSARYLVDNIIVRQQTKGSSSNGL